MHKAIPNHDPSLVLDLNTFPRPRALGAYLAAHGIQRNELARRSNVRPDLLYKQLAGLKPLHAETHQRLVALGVPAELLPEPCERKRKRRAA